MALRVFGTRRRVLRREPWPGIRLPDPRIAPDRASFAFVSASMLPLTARVLSNAVQNNLSQPSSPPPAAPLGLGMGEGERHAE